MNLVDGSVSFRFYQYVLGVGRSNNRLLIECLDESTYEGNRNDNIEIATKAIWFIID